MSLAMLNLYREGVGQDAPRFETVKREDYTLSADALAVMKRLQNALL